MYSSSKTSYIEENGHFSTEFTLKRMCVFKKPLGALRRFKNRLSHCYFSLMRPWKTHTFSPSQMETFPINTAFLIHNFSLRTGAVQEEGDSRSQGGVQSSPIFYRVCFYIFVSCL